MFCNTYFPEISFCIQNREEKVKPFKVNQKEKNLLSLPGNGAKI